MYIYTCLYISFQLDNIDQARNSRLFRRKLKIKNLFILFSAYCYRQNVRYLAV